MHTKTLIAIVMRGGPTFLNVVRYLSESNRRLNLSLLIHKTRRFDCCLPTHISDGFGETQIVDHGDFLHAITDRYPDSRAVFASLDNVALWKSIVLFYAYTKGYDRLILWDEDQYPIWIDRDMDYFEPLLAKLSAGYKIASAKRYGYLILRPWLLLEQSPRRC
jgi:hypothetical protein